MSKKYTKLALETVSRMPVATVVFKPVKESLGDMSAPETFRPFALYKKEIL